MIDTETEQVGGNIPVVCRAYFVLQHNTLPRGCHAKDAKPGAGAAAPGFVVHVTNTLAAARRTARRPPSSGLDAAWNSIRPLSELRRRTRK